MPTEQVLQYFDSRAGGYLTRSQRGIWNQFRRREYWAVTRLLALKPGQRVLDAGCGAGYYALRLRDEFGADVTGLDLSPKMINEFRVHGMPAEVADMASYDGGGRFDRVLLAGMLEFVPDVEAVFRAASRSLKPGGRLVALVPRAGLSGWAYAVTHELAGCPTRVLNRAEYESRAVNAGFHFVESITATPISRAVSWVK